MKPETLRKIQLYEVLLFAFGLAVITSLFIWLRGWHPGPATTRRMIFRIVHELASLALLAWVLRKQGKRFTDIRFFLPPTLADIGHSILLFVGAVIGNGWVYLTLRFIVHFVTGHPVHRTWNISASLFGSTITVLPFLFCFINPFVEELIVRGFFIIEVESIYGSTRLAAFASVIFQASYHLYQGLLSALSLSASFTLFTVYFIRKRRILPVVLAHLYMDLLAVSTYAFFLHRGVHLK
ncbi:MAG TPA: CPBP family intramembrane glutamic endopeptidase [Terriglobales bacterium]|nr:CPBP family intramembrane glutamic endopeptidase [Terriglobales bacterium]